MVIEAMRRRREELEGREKDLQLDARGFYDVTALLKEYDEELPDVENSSLNYRCRAKDPLKCRYHGGFWHAAVKDPLNTQPGGTNAQALGLPKMTAIKGDKVTPLMSAADARKYMNSGNCKVRSVDGDWVEFDHETCRHIEQDHKYPAGDKTGLTEGEDRLQKLADAMRTVVRPHEIWEELDAAGKPKAKLYTRVYDIGPNKKKVTLGVRWEKESHRVHTYYDITKPKTVEKREQENCFTRGTIKTRTCSGSCRTPLLSDSLRDGPQNQKRRPASRYKRF